MHVLRCHVCVRKTEFNLCIWRTGILIQSNSNRWAFRLVSRRGHFKCHIEYQAASKKLLGNLLGHFYRYQLSRTLIRINFKTRSTHTLCGPSKKSFTLSHTWQGNVCCFLSVENGLHYTAWCWREAQESHYVPSSHSGLAGKIAPWKCTNIESPLSFFHSHTHQGLVSVSNLSPRITSKKWVRVGVDSKVIQW